ncbi:helix-turn-helix domain-containing protein [Actinomadura livida]|uniref:Helix-turn-helix transcriptional regulator n=1 Tax=Actinomadura livida TaxID=79909 RepID=A0A7W7ICQ5_9ACTN|nr:MULTISPECIES: helix-turn-helix transcriptional regulator [Actinomadura]MBB4774692.1 transcriptional regulator with XRE-family HTH domain [Actinomadura catellatispora]GGU06602.1 transcriptional regulator [Actinomadura livida]
MPRRPRDPDVPSSPVEYFGVELRAYREAAGMSRPQLAERLGYTPQWIGQVESGKYGPSEDFAKDCDTCFKTNGTFYRLWEWIQRFGRLAVLPPGFPDFIEREREAAGMHIFETMVITGLFQTPEYAYEVLKEGRAREEAEQLVLTRMERQEILTRNDPPYVVAIFDEGAIRRPVGGAEVMKGQIKHLIDLAEAHHITMQFVPSTRGTYAGLPGNFTIMNFTSDSDIVHVGGYLGAQLIDHVDAVRTYGIQFDLIRGAAMSADESLELLQASLESL